MKTNIFSIVNRLTGGACVALALLFSAAAAHAERTVLKYHSEIAVKASPQKAWDSFKNFDSIHKWHPATENTVLLVGQNGKPLAVREFQIKGGAFVISELLSYDESKRRFKYRILKTNLPLSNYVGEMWVVPAAGGGSVIKWSGQFQRPEESPKAGQDDEATSQLVQGVFKAGLDNLALINAK